MVLQCMNNPQAVTIRTPSDTAMLFRPSNIGLYFSWHISETYTRYMVVIPETLNNSTFKIQNDFNKHSQLNNT